MKLEWLIDHGSYWQSHYAVSNNDIIIFEIDYLEATDQYMVHIDTTPYGPWNTFREAQLWCEWYLEWMLEFQFKTKKVLTDLLDL